MEKYFLPQKMSINRNNEVLKLELEYNELSRKFNKRLNIDITLHLISVCASIIAYLYLIFCLVTKTSLPFFLVFFCVGIIWFFNHKYSVNTRKLCEQYLLQIERVFEKIMMEKYSYYEM